MTTKIRTRSVSYTHLTILNAVLDPIFIHFIGFHGAAAATLLSQIICLLFMLIYLKKKKLFAFRLSAFDRKDVLPLIQKAIPSVIQQSIPAISTTFLTALVSTYGVTAIAAYGVTGKLETILFYQMCIRDRLTFAEKMGIRHTILNRSKEALLDAASQATDGDYFDVCIEATGVPEAFVDCIDAAAFQGRIVDVGVSKRNADFRYTGIQRKELNIMGSRAALKTDFLHTIQWVKEGKADLSRIISREYPMEKAEEAFKDLDVYKRQEYFCETCTGGDGQPGRVRTSRQNEDRV